MKQLLGMLLLAVAVHAGAALPEPLAQALQQGGVPPQSVALYVQRVDQPGALLAHQAERAMNPASAMKLVTTYAGLELLGPAYTWPTEAYASVPPDGDVLAGDLILKGYGDPAMMLEDFWLLTRALRQQGLREIRGDLVLDRGHFRLPPFDPGAFDGEPYSPYNAGPDALLVNLKTIRFTVRPAPSGGVAVSAEPELASVQLDNRLRLVDGTCGDWKSRLGYTVSRAPQAAIVRMEGVYARQCGEQVLNLSPLNDAAEYVYPLFRRLWQESGGVLGGGLRPGEAGPGATLLLRRESPPLADVVRLINKYSNNLMARQLLLTLGAHAYGAPGSAEAGARAVCGWLAGKGLAFPELIIDNGSGLSREGRISARHLGELLVAAYASPVMPEFMSSLPVIALDGTLKRRLKASELAGRGHLKTGSLDGVRTLAGYLLDAQGRRWVVVFMAEHARAGDTRALQDALLQWVFEQP